MTKTVRPHAGFLDKLIIGAENFSYFWSNIFRRNIQSYFAIETIQNEQLISRQAATQEDDAIAKQSYTLIATDGSLLTVFEFDGVRSVIDRNAMIEKLTALENSQFADLLKRKGHTIEFFFEMNPDSTETIKTFAQKSKDTIQKFHLNFDHVMDSRASYLPKFIHEEKCYMGIWTHPSAIGEAELKSAIEEKLDWLKNTNVPRFNIKNRNAQYPFGGVSVIFEKHNPICQDIETEFNTQLGFKVKRITAHNALFIVKKIMFNDEVPMDWKPVIFGDKIPHTLRQQQIEKGTQNELSAFLDPMDIVYPPLATQILNADLYQSKTDPRQVIVGNRIFSTISLELPPTNLQPFNALLQKFVDSKLPFITRITIKSDGLSYKGGKASIANALNFLPPNNRAISDAIKEMNIIAKYENFLRYSMSFSTYANIGEESLLRSRLAQMTQLVSSWGSCDSKQYFGDSVEAFFDTVPFISPNSSTEVNYHLAPFYDLFKMMPIFRPASVFENGACLYRSIDGKLIPFEICSPLQQTWAYYIMALPGSGKSVDLAVKILGSMSQFGIERLPYIASIDIGPSQKALIDLIKSAYPPEYRDNAFSMQLTMDTRHAINMFDLPLGCERPEPNHLSLLQNFLSELLTPAGEKVLDSSFVPLIAEIITLAYKKISLIDRDGTPKLYTENTDPQVDEAIRHHNIPIRAKMSWYELRNELFDRQDYKNAERAQRQAVPTIEDLITISQEKSILDSYKNIRVRNNNDILTVFNQLITTAITNYPNLSTYTRLDVSHARIASFDLGSVTMGQGVIAEKQQSLMYMVAKYALTKNFRLTESAVLSDVFPDACKEYHLKRVREMFITNKIVCVDEYHRTKNSPYIQNDFVIDAREGRKWKMAIILSSQQGDDIGDELKNFLTGVFILRAASKENADELQKRFSFGDAEKEALLKYCHGPTGKGAPFLAILSTEQGTTSQILYSTISPVEAFSLTTTAEDVEIKRRLVPILGERESCARLGKAYNFSIKYVLQELRMSESLLNPKGKPIDLIQHLANKILEMPAIYQDSQGSVWDAEYEVKSILTARAKEDENKRAAQRAANAIKRQQQLAAEAESHKEQKS